MPRVRVLAPDHWGGETTKASMRELLGMLIGKRRGTVSGLIVLSILSGLIEAVFLAIVVDIGVSVVSRRGKSTSGGAGSLFHIHASAHVLVLVALGLVLVRAALQVPLVVLPARLASDVQGRLRSEMFASFTAASWSIQSREREGHMQETMTGQVATATSGVVQAATLITQLFNFLVMLAAAFVLNVVAAAVVLSSALVLFALLRPVNQAGVRMARRLSQAQMQYAGGIAQSNRIAEETRVFGVGDQLREQVDGLIETCQRAFFRAQVIGRASPAIYQNAIYLMLVGGLAILVASGRAQAVSLGGVILILYRAGGAGQAVQGSWQNLRQSVPFIERLQETKRRYHASAGTGGKESLQSIETVAFKDVSFAYRPSRPVLSDITFDVTSGETVGVIGPSGAGKSTLVQILLRLRDPDAGEYCVNGIPAMEFLAGEWQKRVAYVPQEPRLIHASVADNIRFFRQMDDEEVEQAATLARIHEDITGWESGYGTIIGPRADAVSGGQQQRICLARALAGQPELLVLDEPTSALDPHSEALIQESLTHLKQRLTLFIIAHRISTLDICDRVMVITDGRLVAFETLASLSESNSYYRSASAFAAGTTGAGLI
jgi:ATP-binding cassette subfamily B protein